MLLRIFTGKNQFWFVGTSKSNSLQEVLKLKQIFQKKKKKKEIVTDKTPFFMMVHFVLTILFVVLYSNNAF